MYEFLSYDLINVLLFPGLRNAAYRDIYNIFVDLITLTGTYCMYIKSNHIPYDLLEKEKVHISAVEGRVMAKAKAQKQKASQTKRAKKGPLNAKKLKIQAWVEKKMADREAKTRAQQKAGEAEYDNYAYNKGYKRILSKIKRHAKKGEMAMTICCNRELRYALGRAPNWYRIGKPYSLNQSKNV